PVPASVPMPARPTGPRPGMGLAAAASGYHHLGASTVGDWSGVLGRVTVGDPAVRRGTFDFVATRFMAKRHVGQRVFWLEAGWAETGWSGEGRQRIYTFDTNRNAWTFYDQYELRPGDDIWFYLHTDAGPGGGAGAPTVWQAWLWWRGGWHLLSAQELPLGARTQLEQFVEVYVDPRHGGPGFAVPPVRVDNVQVKGDPRGELRYWTGDVHSGVGHGRGRYCVQWEQPYDTWSAGDCPAARPGTGHRR
ncbi:MAG TPA: hypothetical protein VNV66_01710, partial [Pilimelia sp.]|nr:hypothetical protein [Pilimelia sp.]